jgi:hypothetical protein
LDIGLREDIEETLQFMVDDRMKSFLKINNFSKTKSPLFDICSSGNFKDIFRKYKLNLKSLFPGITSFSICHKLHFKHKGKKIEMSFNLKVMRLIIKIKKKRFSYSNG